MSFDLMRWTIRLAMIAYVAALALRATSIHRGRRPGDKERGRHGAEDAASNAVSPCLPLSLSPCLDEPRTELLQRTFWSLACLLTWAHVLLAFGTHHHWSHAAAYEHTATETAKKVGIEWGGGIYFNYVFLALWSADAIWWWWNPVAYRARARGFSIFVHAYLAFIAFNATVVFETGPVRYAGIGATIGLGLIAIYSRVVSVSRSQ